LLKVSIEQDKKKEYVLNIQYIQKHYLLKFCSSNIALKQNPDIILFGFKYVIRELKTQTVQ